MPLGPALGSGRTGSVYAGTWSGQPVAVKCVPPEHAGILRTDWTALDSVSHPNVVPVYAFEETPAGARLVMGRADGAFDTIVPDRRTLLRMLQQVAGALDALHEAGWVHRDVKPTNLLLNGRDVWLSDCGLAMRIDSPDPAPPTGTLPYLAPEAFLWQSGPGVDWYALGVTLYELLTGRLPFEADTLQGEILAKQAGRVRSDAGLPSDWATPVRGLMRPDPTERWAGSDVRAWLEAGEAPLSVSA
jgi:serine/threonine protein kinase